MGSVLRPDERSNNCRNEVEIESEAALLKGTGKGGVDILHEGHDLQDA